MVLPSLTLFPDEALFPSGTPFTGPASDGRSTMYVIDDVFAAVNNGAPAVDEFGCWWSVSREEGWASGSAARANVTKWQLRDGQTSSQLQQEARTILIGGTIRAPDQISLQNAMDRVTAVLAGQNRVGILTVAEAHVRRHIAVRRDGQPLVAKVSPYTATFLIQLVADDPRRLGDTLTTSTRLPVTTGGFTIPFTIPFTIVSTVVSGTCSLNNPGKAVGPVVLRIDGPANGPIITHVGTGAAIVFASSYVLSAGNWLTIDMENQTVLENDQASRAGSITQAGWSGFEPDLNTWAFAAAAANPSSLLTVNAAPAYP